MAKKPFEPNFKTPEDLLSKEEKNKLASNGVRGDLKTDFNDESQKDIKWESEQLAKSYGIYLEFNRAEKKEKHWMYMIRIANPGGGPISREQWNAYDSLSEKHCKDPGRNPNVRLTTRQTVQFHWIDKKGTLDIVKTMAEVGHNSLNGCGDNTRNVMACPMTLTSSVFNGREWSHKLGDFFQLPTDPFIQIFEIEPDKFRQPGEVSTKSGKKSFQYGKNLLNRKFKIAFSSIRKDPQTGKIVKGNSTEFLTNDVGIAPIVTGEELTHFQIYVGGGQGEKNGKPTMSALAKPLCRVPKEDFLDTIDAIVAVHQEWGDRQNRHWARLKYVIKAQGVEWFKTQVEEKLGKTIEAADPDYDYGDRELFHGWTQQEDGHWAFGVFIENGRVVDNEENGKVKTMIREIMNKYDVHLVLTPCQDILFTNIPEDQKEQFEQDIDSYQVNQRNGNDFSTLRRWSGACVGRDTCRLTYTDSEKFEPFLLDDLEKMGWGDMKESIGITGCERQCYRPGVKSIGLVGSGLNRYMFKLFGDVSGKHQGRPLVSSNGEELHLRSVPREAVAVVIDFLFKDYQDNKTGDESLGAYHRRIGDDAIIDKLKANEATAEQMVRPFNTDCVLET